MDHIEQIFADYEKAFLPPVREDWGYLPRWDRALDNSYINQIHDKAISWQKTHGFTAEGLFLLALIYKHCNQMERYHACLEQAGQLNPDHLEVSIAQRDGVQYADPFYFPQWDQLRNGSVTLRREILQHQGPSGIFIEQARVGARVFPVFIIKKSMNTFRQRIDHSTEIQIVTDIVSIPPGCEALMFVMPVIFDDPEEPYWTCTYLVPHQGGATMSGIPIVHRGPFVNLPHGDIVIRMCKSPGLCGVIVVNELNKVMLDRLVRFEKEQESRLSEMRAVISLLGDKTMEMEKIRTYSDLHLKGFSVMLKRANGTEVRVPAGRNPKLASLFGSTVEENGRLLIRETITNRDSATPDFLHDVFISHAHKDSDFANILSNWIQSTWPGLRVYLTNPDFEEEFDDDPAYFIRALSKSKCMVLIATKQGLSRPAVGMEIGAAKGKPVVVIYAGDATLDDARKKDRTELFSNLKAQPYVKFGEQNFHLKLAQLLTRGLDLPVNKKIPDFPLLAYSEQLHESQYDPLASFAHDFGRMLEAGIHGTRANQEEILQKVFDDLFKRSNPTEKKNLSVITGLFEPPVVLLFLIANSNIVQEQKVIDILSYVPKLVDMDLFLEANAISESMEGGEERIKWQIICNAIKKMLLR